MTEEYEDQPLFWFARFERLLKIGHREDAEMEDYLKTHHLGPYMVPGGVKPDAVV